MTSGCQPVWQRPSPLLPTFDLFDLKYFCVHEVQAIRVAVLSSLRRYHGQRIKLDRSGASAVKTSLDLRLSWARGEWISLLNETVELFRNKEQLRKLNVIQFVGADSPDSSQAEPVFGGSLGGNGEMFDRSLRPKHDSVPAVIIYWSNLSAVLQQNARAQLLRLPTYGETHCF